MNALPFPPPCAANGAVCLDITRLVSRTGLGPPTGIDRVELAYLRHFLGSGLPLWGIARVGGGQALLDRAALAAVAAWLADPALLGPEDWRARFSRRLPPERRRAEADLRRRALALARGQGLSRALARHLPPGTVYVNAGHSNLSAPLLAALRRVPALRIAVMIHDTIPLDHPAFQRPGTAERFAAMLARVGGAADLVICNSEETHMRLSCHLGRLGARLPPVVVAHLGLDLAPDTFGIPPAGYPDGHPAFVCVGTIEPRKNHALLLDVWERLAQEMPRAALPHLHIAGRRGWCNEAVFARIASVQAAGLPVFEHPALPDADLIALMHGCRAMLLPSRAEGFGLPAVEAAAAGVPLVAADLAIWREVLGDWPICLDPDDTAGWAATVRRLAGTPPAPRRPVPVPGWEAHFARVLPRLIAPPPEVIPCG